MKRNARGFTIVELLIAIVVIGILATISIVAYNGVQQKARNTQVISVVSAYQKALQLYAAAHGSYITYPVLSDFAVCLGEGYTGSCWSGSGGTYSTNTQFDNLLAEFMPTKPKVNPRYHTEGANQRSGVVYLRNEPVGRQSIAYIREGRNQPCQLADAVSANPNLGGTGTRCRLVLP